MNVRSILYATDFSTDSRVALDYAAALASAWNAKLTIVHVDDVTPGLVFGDVGYGYLPEVDRIAYEQHEQLKAMEPTGTTVQCERLLLRGNAADEILAAAESVAADIIVIGTHGRTGLRRALMGSVAEKIVRSAACPVLTVKHPLLGGDVDDEPQATDTPETNTADS